MASDFASWSTYSYVFNNPLIFIDPDGRAPENIIIRVSSNNEKNHGHAAVAVEQYDANGAKTGNVVVYELAGAPAGGELEYKAAAIFGNGVNPDYSAQVVSKDEFLSTSIEGYDGVVEIPTTPGQDQNAHTALQGKRVEGSETPYNPVTNNCATDVCDGVSAALPNTDSNFGSETVTARVEAFGGVSVTKTTKTPNAVFNDAKKLPGATIHQDKGNTNTPFQKYIDNKLN